LKSSQKLFHLWSKGWRKTKTEGGGSREKEEKKKYEPEASDSGFSKIHVLLEDFGISIEQKVPKKPEPRNILRTRVTQMEYDAFMSKDANSYQVRNRGGENESSVEERKREARREEKMKAQLIERRKEGEEASVEQKLTQARSSLAACKFSMPCTEPRGQKF
jgi:hypothetical protein